MGNSVVIPSSVFLQEKVLPAFSMALDVARAHQGATSPNPPVGCVLLDAFGRKLAIGAHRRAGLAHAEVEAIANARASGTASEIDSFVVTLEPCNHHGRTPPCTEALLAAGPRSVWIACRDPNTDVAGGGAERLRTAGIDVRFLSELNHPLVPLLLADAERLLAPFSKRIRTGIPFVTLKQAVSSSGSMVPAAGRKTFTSSHSLELSHYLRRRADAIITGSGTVLADDPLFTVRLVPDHAEKQRMLVILDRRSRTSAAYQRAARQRGFIVHLAKDVRAALNLIGAAGGNEVLVEAGPTLTAHVLAAGLWDEHVLIEQAANQDGTDRLTTYLNSTK